MPEVVIASFNIHGGVDGWGRPFDVVAACAQIDADVLVLQECWAPPDAPGSAEHVGDALGYDVAEFPLARALMFPPHPRPRSGWGPPPWERGLHGVRIDRSPHARRSWVPPSGERFTRGMVTLGVLWRRPVRTLRVIDLGRFLGDAAQRGAIAAEVIAGCTGLWVVGTHLAHIRHGSPVQIARLRRAVAALPGTAPAVIAGDMNLWGPPLAAMLPGWRRAVRGRTWPAWRPVAQIDHVLVPDEVAVVDGGEVVAGVGASDHLPVRVRARLAR